MFQNLNNSIKKNLEKDWFCITIILLLSVASISPMLILGIPDGNMDFPQHLQFAKAYYKSIFAGEFLPVWASSDNYGFGSVGIRIYPPLSSFSLALAGILSGNWFDAIWLSFLVWMFVGCVGVYFWAKEWLSPKYSLVAAALYIVLPYHLLQIYQMWLYAEFVASALIPFCFLFVTRICRQGRAIDVVLFTVSYSLLLLSHIPSAIIGSLSLAVYVFFILDWSFYQKTFFKLLCALALSLSATAFYWVKIITEIDWVRANNLQYSSGYYDPQQHLFPLFFSAGDKYIERVSWHFDLSIILTLLLFLPAIGFLAFHFRKKQLQNREIFFALSGTGLFALFMMSVPSFFVWQAIPTLRKIQFPWRWLSVLTVVSVLAFALAVPHLTALGKKLRKVTAYAILTLIFSILLFDITQSIIESEPITRAGFEKKLIEIRSEPGCDCWWTTWAKSEAFARREKVSAESRGVKINLWSDKNREFEIEEGKAANVRAATFYYPYWQAQVNGQAVPIQKDDDGSILIFVESKKSSIKLYFQEPYFLKFSSVLSALTWVLLFVVLLLFYRSERKSNLLS
jgi:hypothetical protein